MKNKMLLIVILSIVLVVIHAWITKPAHNRYEVVSLNDSNYVVIDHKENKIYQKFVLPNGGPTEFEKLVLPE